MASTDTIKRLQHQKAAYQSWANTVDRTARTAKAREAFELKFFDQVDPNRELSEPERARRAAAARKAYYLDLAAKRLAKRQAAS